MDYGKSGNAKTGKGTPRFSATAKGGAPKPEGDKAADKAALLARMKAAAAARKAAK
jgi:hypothetical protein